MCVYRDGNFIFLGERTSSGEGREREIERERGR